MDAYSNVDEIRQRVGQWATNYWDVTWRYARRLAKNATIADDLTQDAFLQVFHALLARPEYEIKDPKAYLCTTLHRRYLNTQRGKLTKSTTSLDVLSRYGSTDGDLAAIEFRGSTYDEPEHIIEDMENERTVEKLIEATTFEAKIKQTAVLSLVREWKDDLIASELGISPGEVRRRTRLVRGEIQNIYRAHLEEIRE